MPDQWFVGVCLLVGFYWIASSITNAGEELAERLDKLLLEDGE